jgi:LPXTG-motif cell wall-anchored protein
VVGKRVESSDESDSTKDFNFEVSILKEDGSVDTDVNETYGDMTFINGVAAFTLKNGQQLSAKDMPPGTKFRVQEIDVDTDTYTVTTTVGETTEERTFYIGETSVEYTLVTFTNTKKENPSGYSLPNTGGPGTKLFMILGSIMIAGAGLLLWRRKMIY